MRFKQLLSLSLVTATALLSSRGTHAQQEDARLRTTLKKLDAASATFTSAQADFHNELYNSLVKDTTVQDGKVYFLRMKKGGTQMGAKIVGQGARTVEYKNGILRDFIPGAACFNTVQAGDGKAKIDTFLTLGFGGSGTDLEKSWVITDQGPETLAEAGKPVAVEKLLLVPKDKGVQNNVTQVTLWMDLSRGVSLKQVLESPTRDTKTATYSNIKLNEKKIDTKPFEIKGSSCK